MKNLAIKLNKQCTIEKTFSHKALFSKAILKAKDYEKKYNITIDQSEIDNIDTAYIQLIISFIKTCKIENIKINFRGHSTVIENMLKLYNINNLEYVNIEKDIV